jgi:hypothetical protein
LELEEELDGLDGVQDGTAAVALSMQANKVCEKRK